MNVTTTLGVNRRSASAANRQGAQLMLEQPINRAFLVGGPPVPLRSGGEPVDVETST